MKFRDQPPDENRPRKVVTAGVISEESVDFIREFIGTLDRDGIPVEFYHYGTTPVSASKLAPEEMNRVHFCGRKSHEEAIRHVAAADILLVMSSVERAATMGLSSKLFEYLATGKPIIVIRPTVPDAELVAGLPWVLRQDDPDVSDCAEFVRKIENGIVKPDFQWVERFRASYNRRSQTKSLAGMLDELLSESSGAKNSNDPS